MRWMARIPGGKRLWRFGLRWRFRLFQQTRLSRVVVEEVNGMPIIVLPGVFNPRLFWSGEFLAQTVAAEETADGATVLDLGTGTGVAALAAAAKARRVVATDVNPTAVRCARLNFLLNGLNGRIELRQGDLFEPVKGERFDLVLFNPPYFEGTPQSDADLAWRSHGLLHRFAENLPSVLAPGGTVRLVFSTNASEPDLPSLFARYGLRATPVAQRDVVSEVFTVYAVCESDQRSAISGQPDVAKSGRQEL